MTRRGLVLGGGGVTGIAWEVGLLTGLAEAGVDLAAADVVVGTSAGSVVGAMLRCGTALPELYAAQTADPRRETPPSFGLSIFARYAVAVLLARGDARAMGRRLGRWSIERAAAGRTPSLASRYDAIAERLVSPVWSRERLESGEWPDGRLLVTTVEAETGALRVLDGTDGTPLLSAVAASCSVPGVYPPTPVAGRDLIDGGVRSGTNADLARECERVLVLAPMDRSVGPMRGASEQLGPTPHAVVTPDRASVAAIGKNVLDLAARPASARAGHAQAAALVDRVRELWG